jgi:uncharacterized membrane protein
MPCQIADHVAGKRRRRFIKRMRLGQSGGMHIHGTLLNALSGAFLIRFLSMILFGKPETRFSGSCMGIGQA